jgi:UPF0716 protein FxsA
MRFVFSVALIGLPLLDIASLIVVGRHIGALQTLAMVLLAAIGGVLMIRAQGFAILSQARKMLEAGRFPARQAFDGVCALIGGALLVLPGFVSDVLGVLLLLPPCRALLLAMISRQITRSGHFAVWTVERPVGPDREQGGSVIEGEYETVEPARDGAEDEGSGEKSPWRRREVASVVRPDKT